MARQPCAFLGCKKSATFDKPLCYTHWSHWEKWYLEECARCHWVFPVSGSTYDDSGLEEVYPSFLCNDCLHDILLKDKPRLAEVAKAQLEKLGVPVPPERLKPTNRQPLAHAPLKRPNHYVYVLKLSDGQFYVGQTNNLAVRVQEHKDGLQPQTKGKDPRLVIFEVIEGAQDEANKREGELTKLSLTPVGCRRLREMIEQFRQPLKLLDLNA